jgi:uncharacterized protein (TIGR02246 family)
MTVVDLYEKLLTAWNDRDAAAFAGLFSGDGTTVGFDGSQTTGPQIEAHLQPIFADHPTAAYVAKVRGTRALGPDTMLLTAIAGMVPPGQDAIKPEVNVVQTVVAERQAGEWRIVLFQNTPARHDRRPDLVEAHTTELEEARATGAVVTRR